MSGNVSTVVDPNGLNVPNGTSEVSGGSNGMPANGSVDAAVVQELQSKIERLEQDRRNTQAIADKKLAAKQQEYERKMAQLQEQLKGKLTDAEKAELERTETLARAQQFEQQYQALQQQLEQQKLTSEWTNFFSETFGISPAKIDTSNQETLLTSGMAALVEEFEKLKGKEKKVEAPHRPAPGPTLTGTGQPPAQTRTIHDIQKQLATNLGRAVSLDEVFRMAERGELNLNQ